MYDLVEELRLRAYKDIPKMPEKKKVKIKDADKVTVDIEDGKIVFRK